MPVNVFAADTNISSDGSTYYTSTPGTYNLPGGTYYTKKYSTWENAGTKVRVQYNSSKIGTIALNILGDVINNPDKSGRFDFIRTDRNTDVTINMNGHTFTYSGNDVYSLCGFVENSGTDISSSFKDFQHRIEFLCFDGNLCFDKRKGKGYGEALILEYAMAKSEFITDDVLIFKLTGRLQLININRLIHYMDKLSPSKNFVCVVPPQNNSVDSRCFVCNKYYLENIFLKDKFHIDDSVGYYFEHLLFDSLRQNKGKIRIHKIPFFLYWRGISGSLGDRLIEPKCRYWSDFKALYHCMISKL